jgi:rhodanese-related sulfurtransferase
MSSNLEITVAQLIRRIGMPDAPVLIDVRVPDDVAADPQRLPASQWRDFREAQNWAGDFAGHDVVVICQKGHKLSHGVAALLRLAGARAEVLQGGFAGWRAAGGMLLKPERVPPAPAGRGTLWVTRTRPKIDRIACPWLIRRFVDAEARFLFVAPGEVQAVAEKFDATPFDIENVFWSHRGALCTFDVMIDEFGLAHPALDQLARIVRAADTATLDLEPEAAGLLAASLGLSRMFRDDLEQLEKGLLIYDAFYRWCRDASGETHNWPNPGAQA